MVEMGVMYINGYGVTKDYTKAEKWFKKAAESGNAKAMNNMGVIYANGLGVAVNQTEALRWFKKAANHGNEGAQKTLTEVGVSW